MTQELSLWTKKITILLVIWGFLYVSYLLRDIVFIVVLSGFLTIMVNPLVDLGEKYRVPAWITLTLVLLIVFLLGSIVVGTLVPIVVNYVSDVVNAVSSWTLKAKEIYTTEWIHGFHFHPYIERGILFLFWEANIDHTLDMIKQNAGNIQAFLTNQISNITTGSISIVGQVGWVVGLWIITIVSTFLMVLERRALGRYILSLFSRRHSEMLERHYRETQRVFTSWLKATLILSLSIFLMTYVWLTMVRWVFDIDTERTFTLALIGGIMEFIPYVGPLIALVPAVIIALGISWKAAAIITILYLLIQRAENDVLVPYVMSKALDLSPFLVFIVMLAGASLWWVLGIIFAVPVAWVLRIIIEEYRTRTSTVDKSQEKTEKKLTTSRKSISSKKSTL